MRVYLPALLLLVSCGVACQSAPAGGQTETKAQAPVLAPVPAAGTTPAPAPAASGNEAAPAPAQAVVVKGSADACRLLTASDIQSVQGEALRQMQGDEPAGSQFLISQCFYATENFNNSVSLTLTRRNPARPGAESPREFWEEKFGGVGGRKRERERERVRGAEREEREEEEEGRQPPLKVDGVGDAAYWVGNAKAGALYVLRGDRFLRLSVGGPDEQPVKINKLKTLARQALRRL